MSGSVTNSLSGYDGPPPGGCDVWWMAPIGPSPDRLALLDAVERERAERYVRSADRDRFVTGVVLAKTVLAACIGAQPPEIVFDRRCDRCAQPHGRPRLAGMGGAPSFSVSHSGAWVVLALAGVGVDIGVDVEELTSMPDERSLARRVLSVDEYAVYVASADPTAVFYRYWTAKESLVKATGEGLGLALESVRVPPPDDEAGASSVVGRPHLLATTCRLSAPEAYAAAVTTLTATVTRLRTFWASLYADSTGGLWSVHS